MGRLAFLGLLLFSGSAWAQYDDAECRGNPHLSRAKDEYERLEFDRAARTLQRAVEFTRNCRWDLAEIYRLKGFVDAVNNERERCQRSFEILLALDPDFVMAENVPPKIQSCFDEALEVPRVQRQLILQHESLATVLPDAPLSIDVLLEDPLRLVNEIEVYFRRDGVDVFTTVKARADDRVSVVLPALALPGGAEAYEVEYFVRAVDRWEGTLTQLGEAREPLNFTVARAKGSRSVFKKWWFWSTVGAAAAGGVATAVVLSQGGSDDIDFVVDTRVAGGR
ncbi:MAG: hypothetical protein AAGD10_18190 [Myxococcota bacterium]